MSNRKKIEKFCEEHDITITNLEFSRRSDWIYGDYRRADCWELECLINGKEYDFESNLGDNVADGIEEMFKAILFEIEEGEPS